MAPKAKASPAPGAGPGAPPTPIAQQAPPPQPPVALDTPAPPQPVMPPMPIAARAVAPQKKKGRFVTKMPGAKSGFPTRLAEQLRDYFIIGLVMAGVAALGNAKAEVAAHGHGHGGHGDGHGHEAAHHRVLTSASGLVGRMLNGHADPTLDMQVTLGICVVLITVTIIFEIAKHHLEHNCPPMMQAILQAMFGELTVLGFIALYTYFMLRLGVLEWVSLQIYHDPEHLIHLFEDIHFMLFFVMLTFLVQVTHPLHNAHPLHKSDTHTPLPL